MTSTLITDVSIVTVDDDFTVHERGWLHVVDDRIEGLGAGDPPGSVTRSTPTANVIDGNGHALMPGMINGHTHLFQTFFRGLGDDKSLLDWLRDYIWPASGNLTSADAEVAAQLGMIENLRSGATSILDHQYVHPDPLIDDAFCQAANDLGVRYYLARGWADRNYDPKLQQDVATILKQADDLQRKWHGHDNDRIRIQHAPLIPWGCSNETMRATVKASNEWGGGTHVHCAETQTEVTMSLEERKLRHVPWLHSLGALGPNTQLAHSVWLNDDELDLIASTGSNVVHCPTSNMYLASGVARIPEMLQRGINVALASDGPGSNNRQDMFEAMKLCVLLQKVHTLNPTILLPEDALKMACRGGAKAFGLAEDIGALTIDRKADIVMVDLRSVFVAPVHRVPSALVFNVTPRDVQMVMVDGHIRIRDGLIIDKLTGGIFNERALISKANELCEQLFARSNIHTGLHTRNQ
jgi:5-methylthioadenosine/S-adenosylhomocysteine deaminase